MTLSIRSSTTADAEIIAYQREQVFVDMGDMTPEEAQAQHDLWADWLREAIPAGEYVGLLAEVDGQIAGSVGLMFFPKFPTHQDRATKKGYIMNMYVSPTHRRQGLAEALMQAIMAEAHSHGLRSLNLNAAPMGKRLYERLGFVESRHPEMRLVLEPS